MERTDLIRVIEAVVMVADQPLEPGILAELTETPLAEVEAACQELAAGYEVDGRGFILARVAGGWRFQSHPDLAPWVERYVLEGQSARLSAAALETLAIVAYKQPVSRAQVGAIRGVNVDAVMRTLEQRGYIGEIGRDPGPGQAVLFGTTAAFLEKLGLDSLDDLPPLNEFVPAPDVVEALEHGLRPEPAPAPPVEVVPVEAAPPVDAAEVEVDDDAVELPPDPGDPLERLDETTARLDALVSEVRDRLAVAEAAVAEIDAEEQDGEVTDPVGTAADGA
jgi:segregation and condensation protein B